VSKYRVSIFYENIFCASLHSSSVAAKESLCQYLDKPCVDKRIGVVESDRKPTRLFYQGVEYVSKTHEEEKS